MTEAQLYSGNPLLDPYPGIPEHLPVAVRARLRSTLDDATQLFPELSEHTAEVKPEADFEDFWEEAARAAAAVRAAAAAGVTIERHNARVWNEDQLARRLGGVSVGEEARHAVDPLLDSAVVREHGGRWMSVGCVPDDPADPREDNLLRQLADRYRRGVRHAVIKLAARKAGVFKITLHETPEAIAQELSSHEVIGWDLLRNGDHADAYLAQDFVMMEHEYRFFIVDGMVVSGAGCIEEFTPFDRDPAEGPFSAILRRRRGNSLIPAIDEPLVVGAPLVRRYIEFIEPIAAANGGTVVMDVATAAATGEPLVIELNTLPNCGLYASDVDAVYLALITANDRGYGNYAFTPADPLTGITLTETGHHDHIA